jgi:Fe-S cluster biogenesis protein NfuA
MSKNEEINQVLDSIREYLQADGGNVELVKFEDGIVYVAMLGACQHCASKTATVNDVIEATLLEHVPGVIGVEVVN